MIPATKRPRTYALDHMATGIGKLKSVSQNENSIILNVFIAMNTYDHFPKLKKKSYSQHVRSK
jgi:hypothetical protein